MLPFTALLLTMCCITTEKKKKRETKELLDYPCKKKKKLRTFYHSIEFKEPLITIQPERKTKKF